VRARTGLCPVVERCKITVMIRRSCLIVLLASAVLAPRMPAQAVHPTSPVGVWRGTSLCLVRPSPCHDEVVVYRITAATASDSVSIDARKIVDSREEEMGVLPCGVAAGGTSVTCTMRNGVWRFSVRGDSLVGELRLPDGTKFRDVRLVRR
jgi:hypothetical protein